MPRTTAMWFAPLAVLTFFATPAHAADEDTQLWLSIAANVPLGEAATAIFEISPRIREGDDQLLLRASAEAELAEGVTVNGGMTLVKSAHAQEIRPHQQLNLVAGPLSIRTRLEERFFSGGDRPQFRLRQRVQLGWKLDTATQIAGSVEALYILRSEVPNGKARMDQWRGEIALKRKLSPHLDASLAYRGNYYPRENAPDRYSHVPVVSATWKL